MDSISKVGLEQSMDISRSAAGSNKNLFSKIIEQESANVLLDGRNRYGESGQLRQSDDAIAVKTPDKIMAGNDPEYEQSPEPMVAIPESPLESNKIQPSAEVAENAPGIIRDEHQVILNVEYERFVLNDGLLGYSDSQRLFIPLSEISRTLDFNINVNAEKGTASGWFISEDRTFSLDMSKGRVVTGPKTLAVPSDGIAAADGEIYVDSSLLSQWFPVDFQLDFANQSIAVNPREKLPFQKRIEREQGWIRLEGQSDDGTRFPRKNSEYGMLSVPFADLGLKTSYSDRDDGNDGYKTDFYLSAKGDFGKMNSEVYFSGNDKEGVDTSRITLRRKDPNAQMLGPLKATGISAGDIRVAELPMIGGGLERGIGVTNAKILRPREYDTTYFEGNLPPDWDVEVYRNGTLVGSQRVGIEGQYSFSDVPVYYGKNDFKLVFYGPQGQERIETKTINVGNDLLKKGEHEYQITLSQKNAQVYDPDETIDLEDEDTPKLNFLYSYGLGGNLSVGGGLSSQEVGGDRHNYLNFGAKKSFDNLYLSGDFLQDTRGGNAVEMLAQTGINDISLRFKKRFYNGLDTTSGSLNDLKSQTAVSASGKIDKKGELPDIPYTLSYGETEKDDSTYRYLDGRLSANIKNINLSSGLRWSENDESDDAASWTGDFQTTAQLGDFRLQGRLTYDLDPDPTLTAAELSNFLRIDDNLSAELSLSKYMDDQKELAGTMGLNWKHDNFTLSPQFSYDDRGNWQAFLGISTSFGMEPRSGKLKASSTRMADSGAVSARVYHDKNYNGTFDAGDEHIDGAVVKAVQSDKKAESDETGVAFLTGLQKYKPTDIVLDKSTLEDPFWEPIAKNLSIVPRPGHVEQIDIPVVTTGEIDGRIVIESEDGEKKYLSNVKVQLIDEKGKMVQETRSAYDGFYCFQKILPGKYSVQVTPEDDQNIDSASQEVKIDSEGALALGNDITLKSREIRMADEKPVELENQSQVAMGESPRQATDKVDPLRRPGIAQAMQGRAPILEPQIPMAPSASFDILKAEPPKQRPLEIKSLKDEPVAPQVPVLNSSLSPRFGLHLSSYRTQEKAAAGIKYLMDKYKGILDDADFTIKKVHVSKEKGVWYRVVAGAFDTKEQLKTMQNRIKMASPYAKIITLDGNNEGRVYKGVHLTSFRTVKKAKLSIEELKNQYPSLLKETQFTIKEKDLGPEMGKWNRVIAGNFSNNEEAQTLARKIKMKTPYCKDIELQKQEQFGIHLASYRSSANAYKGLRVIQKKLGPLLNNEEISLRKVNLGPEKGIWYRIIAGEFEEKNSGEDLKQTLKQMNQYAHIIKF
ncbi:SPOR domain-containing protein [uncultured Desulfobacter sp.]|uniref:SPOR domain-containing protein n=1 Tax=uncultured Desulfobacter sp. TaxID=240139 RepID=UPI002AAB69C7|nr:SPOR domain-containing protein [uncultured Desulfobacter sp.]